MHNHVSGHLKADKGVASAEIFEAVSAFLGAVMPPVLISAGLYFAAKVRFFYVLHPSRTVRLMTARRGDGISPMRAATMALAGTLGVGNITGVCAAIASGGAGAVFWMWVSALIAMSVKYAETVLAVVFRRRDGGGYIGGAPFYIADGLTLIRRSGKKSRLPAFVGAVFAVMCVANSFTVGGVLQVNAAGTSASELFSVSPYIVGAVLAVLTFAAVSGGAERISGVTSFIIPAVSALYIAMCLAVIFICREDMPEVIRRIFTDAFSLRAAAGGGGGYMISAAIRYGVVRGVITNEAGAGTSPTAHACADAYSPEAQGCLGIFEVFADTIVICTLTAFAVLASGGGQLFVTGDAMTTAMTSFSSVLGGWSDAALVVSVFVFVLATLLSQHYYARVSIRFLGGGRFAESIFTILYMAMIVIGSGMAPRAVWLSADITVGLMTTVNVVCLFMLRRFVSAPDVCADGAAKKKTGRDPGR